MAKEYESGTFISDLEWALQAKITGLPTGPNQWGELAKQICVVHGMNPAAFDIGSTKIKTSRDSYDDGTYFKEVP